MSDAVCNAVRTRSSVFHKHKPFAVDFYDAWREAAIGRYNITSSVYVLELDNNTKATVCDVVTKTRDVVCCQCCVQRRRKE